MKTAKEYRAQAKKLLQGKMGAAILLILIYGILLSALAYTGIGELILGGVLTVGVCIAFLRLQREGTLEIGDLFSGFNKCKFVSTIGLYVKTAIFTFLWSLLLIVPGIIAVFSYSMAPYIMADHPEMTGGEAITASKALMNGKKWKLFCLLISYIGWIVLSCLTFGILLLWVGPWMQAAETAFYEDIKDEVIAPAGKTEL